MSSEFGEGKSKEDDSQRYVGSNFRWFGEMTLFEFYIF
jgi:hypothetical protein